MPALASPVADERSALREYLAYHQSAFFAVAYGLTDEQARMTPTVSASRAARVKHWLRKRLGNSPAIHCDCS